MKVVIISLLIFIILLLITFIFCACKVASIADEQRLELYH